MITFPNAKINLGLNITEKRADGYHNLETIFYPIHLQDALEVTRREKDDTPYTLHVKGTALEGAPEDNLVVKAYELLKKDYEMPPIDIHLFKHIPTGAGLGGGSSDCAFMIKLLNEKFRLNLSLEEMESYAARLGADCAFFIRNQPVFATGIGNIFEPIRLSLSGCYLVLVKPDIFVSTREQRRQLVLQLVRVLILVDHDIVEFALVIRPHITPHKPEVSLKDIVRQPVETWKDSMKNDFEDSVFLQHPEIAAIKDELYDLGAVFASMSGSGSSVYGIFRQPVENVDEKFGGCFCRQRELD